MKRTIYLSGAILLAAFLSSSIAAAQPASVSLHVTAPKNALWDLTRIASLQQVSMDFSVDPQLQVGFDAPFTQSGTGKLSGSGTNVVFVQYQSEGQTITVPPFAGKYTSRGSITSNKGIAKMALTQTASGLANMEGKNRKVTATVTYSVTLNANSNSVTGRITEVGSAAGLGSVSQKDTFGPESIPTELGDGSWTLSIVFQPPQKNKLTGSANLTLASGAAYRFVVSGTYNPKNQQSKVTLKGFGTATGALLQVGMMGADTITKVSGRFAGQSVLYTP